MSEAVSLSTVNIHPTQDDAASECDAPLASAGIQICSPWSVACPTPYLLLV